MDLYSLESYSRILIHRSRDNYIRSVFHESGFIDVQARNKFFTITVALLLSVAVVQRSSFAGTTRSPRKSVQAVQRKLTPQEQFAIDTVKMVVALPPAGPHAS